MTLGILHGFVRNQGDAWRFTEDELRRYFERAITLSPNVSPESIPPGGFMELLDKKPPSVVQELIGGSYLEAVRLLGQRTAEMHIALASATEDPAFAPEAFGTHYQRSLYQAMRNVTSRACTLLEDHLESLPELVRATARRLLDQRDRILAIFHRMVGRKLIARRIRCHGDYHLGQVLYTGRDFVIIDFEGEPARPLSERRIKRSPLRDVAGMLRSFDYAVHAPLQRAASNGTVRPEDIPRMIPFADLWRAWVSSAFVRSYARHVRRARLLPDNPADLRLLLTVFQLEKALYEIGYELNSRPQWAEIPMRGALSILNEP